MLDQQLAVHCDNILKLYYNIENYDIKKINTGKVNDTFKVVSGQEEYILQRINQNFINYYDQAENCYQLQQHIKDSDLKIPEIIKTNTNELLANYNNRFWKLSHYISGYSPIDKNKITAAKAAKYLGSFHTLINKPRPLVLIQNSLANINNQYLCSPHDFESFTYRYRGHPNLKKLEHLLPRAVKAASLLPVFYPKLKIVFFEKNYLTHSDPKADNFIFNNSNECVGIIDLDSVCLGSHLIDLADFCRSWAYIKDSESLICKEIYYNSIKSYLETGLPLNKDDLALLPTVIRAIVVNLARRYLKDSLEEVYFTWDKENYDSLFIQNSERADLMINFAEKLFESEFELRTISLNI